MSQTENSPVTEGGSAFSEALDLVLPAYDGGDEVVFDEHTLGQSNSVFGGTEPHAQHVQQIPASAYGGGPLALPGPQMIPAAKTTITSDDLTGRERRSRVRLQARKVRRIIRHIEPWSIFKVSVVFYACMWVIMVLAGLMLWSVAVSSGTIESAEDFIATLVGSEEGDFTIPGEALFQAYALGGLVLAVAGVAFNVLLCVLFNLISDLMGGIRLTVIEEESARFRPPRRRRR